ncbi:lytic transglycosylase domain-containing protein [Aurantimonas coralicida]|nr:transglycosylase SLT domain-containing protein [Aurantimonas coralicida]
MTTAFANDTTSEITSATQVAALERFADRPFATIIAKEAAAHGVPLNLAHAVINIESSYRSSVTGAAGEVGLMQIKPATARGMGYRGSTEALYDPATNIKWGMRYLAGAVQRGGGTTCGTILKYNAGHYAKRMNPISQRYCSKVKRELAQA